MSEPKPLPKIELWPIERLIPSPKNPKKHPKDQVKKLARAIEAQGWTTAIVVDAWDEIIAGHGRRLAAMELGQKTVPVIVRADLTKAEADAARLSDNRVVSTDYDTELMRQAIAELAAVDFDMEILGFDDKELAFLNDEVAMMDESVFVHDIADAVDEQKEENTKTAAATDAGDQPVGDAFGFKRLPIAQGRRVRAFMDRIAAETGKEGADALMSFFDELGVAA